MTRPETPNGPATWLLRGSYLVLLLWQWVWYSGLLTGEQGNWLITLVISGLMLIPLPGLLRMDRKAITWGGFLVIFLFVVAVGEAWAVPAERLTGSVQIGLCLAYLSGLWRFGRRR